MYVAFLLRCWFSTELGLFIVYWLWDFSTSSNLTANLYFAVAAGSLVVCPWLCTRTEYIFKSSSDLWFSTRSWPWGHIHLAVEVKYNEGDVYHQPVYHHHRIPHMHLWALSLCMLWMFFVLTCHLLRKSKPHLRLLIVRGSWKQNGVRSGHFIGKISLESHCLQLVLYILGIYVAECRFFTATKFHLSNMSYYKDIFAMRTYIICGKKKIFWIPVGIFGVGTLLFNIISTFSKDGNNIQCKAWLINSPVFRTGSQNPRLANPIQSWTVRSPRVVSLPSYRWTGGMGRYSWYSWQYMMEVIDPSCRMMGISIRV